MRNLQIVMLLLLSIACLRISAQDNVAVLQPYDILSSDVQLIEKLPILNIHDDTRTLDYFNPNTDSWITFSYPDQLQEIEDVRYYVQERSDGTYMINPHGFWGFRLQLADHAWIFNPDEGNFYRPEAVCDGLVRALPDEGEWIIRNTDDEYYLCFTENGEVSPPIPYESDDGYCFDQWRKPVVVSPNNKYVLFFCGGTTFSAFSYILETQTFNYLGESSERMNENVEIVRWLSDTKVILHAYPSWNPPANVYYIADVEVTNGLTFVNWGLYVAPIYIDMPPHLEWVPCEFGSCSPGEQAGLLYYDFATQELVVYPHLPNINGVSLTIPDGTADRIYRSLNYPANRQPTAFPYTAPSATLIRFNYETEQQEEIFTGEIEWIENFSPDGRYLVLEMGDNDEVASSFLLAENQAGYDPVGNAGLAILDLQTNTIVYEAVGERWGLNEFGFDPLYLTWLDNERFLIHGADENLDQLIKLGDSVEILATFENSSTFLSPDNQFIRVNNENAPLSIYDIDNQELMPIIENNVADDYEVSSQWYDVQQVLLTIRDGDVTLARWVVDFTQSN